MHDPTLDSSSKVLRLPWPEASSALARPVPEPRRTDHLATFRGLAFAMVFQLIALAALAGIWELWRLAR